MARRRGGPKDGDTGNWLNTYADMVTLLLTFFILLFSMSSLDAAKFNMLVKAFASDKDSSEQIIINGDDEGEIMGGDLSANMDLDNIVDLDDIFRYLDEYVRANNYEDKVQVSQGDGYVFIRFMDDMLFEPNSSRLRASDMELLEFVGWGIKSIEGQVDMIRVDGHTAAIPENPNYEVSDRTLSSERANRVLMYFEDEIHIDSTKLVQVAFGKWMPIASNDNEIERSQNRRVEIIISSDNILMEQLDNIYENLVE